MRIGVLGDTHGDDRGIKRVVAALEVSSPMDMWFHTGDCSDDIGYLQQYVQAPVIVVAGNCDMRVVAQEDEFLEICGKKIWLTHGHHHKVKHDTKELSRMAKRRQVNIVIYGHTHVPDITWEQDLLLFNPGSTSLPRDNRQTCGFLEITRTQIDAKIVEL